MQSVSGLFRHGSGPLLQVCSSGWSCGLWPSRMVWRRIGSFAVLAAGFQVPFALFRSGRLFSVSFADMIRESAEVRRLFRVQLRQVSKREGFRRRFRLCSRLVPACVRNGSRVVPAGCSAWHPGADFPLVCSWPPPGRYLPSGLVVTCPAGSGIVSGRIRAGSHCGFFPGFGSFSGWLQM